jgi:hypothetical protein
MWRSGRLTGVTRLALNRRFFSSSQQPKPGASVDDSLSRKTISGSGIPTTSMMQRFWGLLKWLRETAKEKGKPFIAWYVTLYFGGLMGAYGIVRWYGKVEPESVREWAYKLRVDKIVDIESIELTKKNCEYFAALLLNESVDTPRLILAVLTIDRVILAGRRVLRK